MELNKCPTAGIPPKAMEWSPYHHQELATGMRMQWDTGETGNWNRTFQQGMRNNNSTNEIRANQYKNWKTWLTHKLNWVKKFRVYNEQSTRLQSTLYDDNLITFLKATNNFYKMKRWNHTHKQHAGIQAAEHTTQWRAAAASPEQIDQPRTWIAWLYITIQW